MTKPEGLSEQEAAARLALHGRNVLAREKSRAIVLQLLVRFANPLLLLLLGASIVSALTGDLASSTVIIAMVALSVVLDFVQERRAGQAAETLRRAATLHATVVRGGRQREVPAEDLVPGDVVLLSAGDLIPADGELTDARDLFVNQALLTGEPYPVEKRPGPSDGQDPAAAPGAVFMGTSVISGSGRAVITRTGPATMMGQIGAALVRRPPPTAFEMGTRNFGLLIVRLAVLMVLFVIFVNLIRDRPWLQSFLFAIALAVGLTPELLPMVVSVTLARGGLRMSRKKVLVKRLAAIHDLGSMDLLCTDKTGTLTEAHIRLEQHLDPAGRDSARVLELAYLNSVFESGLRSPLDEAILRHEKVDVSAWRKIDEVPFDFERRRVSVLVARDELRLLIVKGAFEEILRIATHYEADGAADVRPLDEPMRRTLTQRFEALGQEGYRVLGVAWRSEPAGCQHVELRDETELVFAGFAAFEDPPKESAAAALGALQQAGVQVMVVTGDNELVTTHLCRKLGMEVRGVLTGNELAALDDQALAARLGSINVFCRVNPAQKNRLILAFKRRGHVVGYLGDGINDAPALHSADVGISVEGAVDVAKDAADLILLEPDLAVLGEGIREGRRTLGNILKYIMMGTSSNFGNMFSMAGASVFLPFLPMLPMQVLVNNFLYDLSEVPIPTDRVDDAFLARPHRWDMSFIRRFMMVIGPISSVFDFAIFGLMLVLFAGDERLFQTGWFVESLATQVLVIFVIRTRGSPFSSLPSRPVAITALTVVAVAIVLPFSALGPALGFVPLPGIFFALLGPLVVTYLVAVELAKRWFYRRAPGA